MRACGRVQMEEVSVVTSVFECAGRGAERKCQCYHPEHGKSGWVCDRVVMRAYGCVERVCDRVVMRAYGCVERVCDRVVISVCGCVQMEEAGAGAGAGAGVEQSGVHDDDDHDNDHRHEVEEQNDYLAMEMYVHTSDIEYWLWRGLIQPGQGRSRSAPARLMEEAGAGAAGQGVFGRTRSAPAQFRFRREEAGAGATGQGQSNTLSLPLPTEEDPLFAFTKGSLPKILEERLEDARKYYRHMILKAVQRGTRPSARLLRGRQIHGLDIRISYWLENHEQLPKQYSSTLALLKAEDKLSNWIDEFN
jgi:hypothetical protein